jgi:hypothetical protein
MPQVASPEPQDAAAAAAAAAQQQHQMLLMQQQHQQQQWGMAGQHGMGFVPSGVVPMAGPVAVPLAHQGSGGLAPIGAGDPSMALLGAMSCGAVDAAALTAAAAAQPPMGRGRKRGGAAGAASSGSCGPPAGAAAAAVDAAINAAALAAIEQTGALGEDDPLRLICQVPGCGKDLSGLKDYHQRYRICAVHIKLPQVGAHGWGPLGGARPGRRLVPRAALCEPGTVFCPSAVRFE